MKAQPRLEAGRRIRADARLTVSGFCTPGWLKATSLPALFAELGFRYDVGMSVLHHLTQGDASLGSHGSGRSVLLDRVAIQRLL